MLEPLVEDLRDIPLLVPLGVQHPDRSGHRSAIDDHLVPLGSIQGVFPRGLGGRGLRGDQEDRVGLHDLGLLDGLGVGLLRHGMLHLVNKKRLYCSLSYKTNIADLAKKKTGKIRKFTEINGKNRKKLD